jgi:hypothetical protein
MKITTQYQSAVPLRVWQMFLPVLLLCLLTRTATQAQDLGEPAYSKLTWDQIMNTGGNSIDLTIGLTTDNRIYVWGSNENFTIHTQAVPSTSSAPPGFPLVQTTPYYVPSPAGEKVIKVAAAAANIGVAFGSNINSGFFGCLTESGKLYGWGINTGMFANANAGWPTLPNGTFFTGTDSTVSKRTPQQLTILGESQFVDFAFPSFSNFWIAIGASGKAYHIGDNGAGTYDGTFAAIPIPAGADAATFKYVRVWCPTGRGTQYPQIYLKGNDGNIYFSGKIGNGMAMGVPAYYSDPNTNTFPDAGGSPPSSIQNLRTAIPALVPFPAGEDIVKMEFSGGTGRSSESYYAISASGKAFVAGFWGMGYKDIVLSNYTNKRYFAHPLAQPPVLGTELAKTVSGGDTLYALKRFVQIAMPASASKIIDIEDFGLSSDEADRQWRSTLIVTDENKAYWAGRRYAEYYIFPNYLQYSDPYLVADCGSVGREVTNSQTQWTVEAINYRGIAKMFFLPDAGNSYMRRFIVSKTGRGYFEGNISAGSGLGKVASGAPHARYPIPIANEQLDNCNVSSGTGGDWTGGITPAPTNTAVGTIDCSKTQIAPAPVSGTPSQTTLMVSIDVTTAGTFTPITVSGSGMSLGNGVTSVSTTTTGVQTFYIPIQYDGTPLTNAFQFTVGSAGSCTADLTQKPNKQVTNVWSLTNCSAITPGTLSK